MSTVIECKGYTGSVEFSSEDTLFLGKVLGIRSNTSYEGKNTNELIADFHWAVDDYREMCIAEGIEPEKA